jgi:hypothetical protein
LERRLEPRLEIGGNFEVQFDQAFRAAFTSVPLALPIPRQPATETYGFPLFDREVPLVATLDAPTESTRRRQNVPRTRSSAGRTLPRAYVARRAATPGELVVRTTPRTPAPIAAPVPARVEEPTPPAPPTTAVALVSTPATTPSTPPGHMPLFSAFAASGVLSAATEGNTGQTRESFGVRAEPLAVPAPAPVADRPVPLQRTVETPRRRSTPMARPRVVRQPRGLALIAHWLRQVRLRHLALLIIGLITIAAAVAFALGYLPEPGSATGPAPTPHTARPAANPAPQRI